MSFYVRDNKILFNLPTSFVENDDVDMNSHKLLKNTKIFTRRQQNFFSTHIK